MKHSVGNDKICKVAVECIGAKRRHQFTLEMQLFSTLASPPPRIRYEKLIRFNSSAASLSVGQHGYVSVASIHIRWP